jgi:O-antigen/teichoic acid export membrane protein
LTSPHQEISSPPPTSPPPKKIPHDPLKNLSVLKRLAIKGSIWVLVGFGIEQMVRLGGNIILTRLLTPEAFGMMGIVTTFIMGLEMFSDVGLKPNIIQNKRGEEPSFLRTAWSIQIIRGFSLAAFAGALAWPIALANGEPLLTWLIAAAGLTMIISGFNSTWLLVYSRQMRLKRLVLLEMTSQITGLSVMIFGAWLYPSVWVLIGGTIVSRIITLTVSHTVFRGAVKMHWEWEPTAAQELVRFGRWVFISSALGFLVMRLDIFIFGSVAGMAALGFFIIAKTLSRFVTVAITKLSTTILLPVYSRLAERDAATLRRNTFKIRGALLLLSLPPLWILTIWGSDIIALLYDERYQDAGWMLQISAAGSVPTVVLTTIYPVLLAVGDSFGHLIKSVARLVFQILGMIIGGHLAGVPGFMIGLALADLFAYPVMVYLIRPYGVWLPLLDALAFASSGIVVAIAWWMS